MDIYILIEEKNAMKILFSGEVFYPFVGGGSISMYTLFKELAKDHEVYAICSGSEYGQILGESSLQNNLLRLYYPHELTPVFPIFLLCIFLRR